MRVLSSLSATFLVSIAGCQSASEDPRDSAPLLMSEATNPIDSLFVAYDQHEANRSSLLGLIEIGCGKEYTVQGVRTILEPHEVEMITIAVRLNDLLLIREWTRALTIANTTLLIAINAALPECEEALGVAPTPF